MKYVPCNVCLADNWTVLYPNTLPSNDSDSLQVEAFRCTNSGYGEHTQIVRCHECGHIYANPTWEPHELIEAYAAVEDETYVDEREGRELTFSKHLQALENYTGSAENRTLLDVGAYIGVFVEVAAAAGWRARGVDPSHWAVGEAQKNGLDVIQGTLDSAELGDAQFDVLTMFDVIEHLEDPRTVLEQSFSRLKPGGTIAIHTMDVDSLTAKLMRGRWPWYMAMHVHFFGKRSLARLMRDVGFEILATPTEGRYLRLGYLATRVGGLSKPLGRLVGRVIGRLNLAATPVPINFGDLFTVYARRPK